MKVRTFAIGVQQIPPEFRYPPWSTEGGPLERAWRNSETQASVVDGLTEDGLHWEFLYSENAVDQHTWHYF